VKTRFLESIKTIFRRILPVSHFQFVYPFMLKQLSRWLSGDFEGNDDTQYLPDTTSKASPSAGSESRNGWCSCCNPQPPDKLNIAESPRKSRQDIAKSQRRPVDFVGIQESDFDAPVRIAMRPGRRASGSRSPTRGKGGSSPVRQTARERSTDDAFWMAMDLTKLPITPELERAKKNHNIRTG
jgi:hypothetical protein